MVSYSVTAQAMAVDLSYLKVCRWLFLQRRPNQKRFFPTGKLRDKDVQRFLRKTYSCLVRKNTHEQKLMDNHTQTFTYLKQAEACHF